MVGKRVMLIIDIGIIGGDKINPSYINGFLFSF